MPSIVTIERSPTSDTGTTHDLVATPSRCTVQAPQALMPQPYFVPVIFSSSRKTQRSGVDGSTLISLRWPFTLSRNVAITALPIFLADMACLRPPTCELLRRTLRAISAAPSACFRRVFVPDSRPKAQAALPRDASIMHGHPYFHSCRDRLRRDTRPHLITIARYGLANASTAAPGANSVRREHQCSRRSLPDDNSRNSVRARPCLQARE